MISLPTRAGTRPLVIERLREPRANDTPRMFVAPVPPAPTDRE